MGYTAVKEHAYELFNVAALKVIMEQYKLGVAGLPEIGSKSLVSRILRGERRLTRNHIEALSRRFNLSPALFFQHT